jgi:hypothetical protein
MAGISGQITDAVMRLLQGKTDGVNARLGAMEEADSSLHAKDIRAITALNAGVEISEKNGYTHYPLLLVYCDKMSNSLKEKFRRFSGKAHVVIEVRHSEDRLEQLDANCQTYVDAVCAMLDDSRGSIGDGTFYAGGYEVAYEPIVRGGKSFLQRARVGFEVEISR